MSKENKYAAETAAGVGLGVAASSNRIPEAVNAGVRLKRKSDLWHSEQRMKGGMGKTKDGRYIRLDRLSDVKPPKPETQFTADGKPFKPKQGKSPRVEAQNRMGEERTARAQRMNSQMPFPTDKWKVDESGKKIKFTTNAKGKKVRTPAALGELRRNTLIGVGIPAGIALTWHGARNWAKESQKGKKTKIVKKYTRKDDVDAGVAGGLTGMALYHAPSHAEWALRSKTNSKASPEADKIINDWKNKYDLHREQKGSPKWKKAYRNYPKGAPGWKNARLQSHLYTGKRGMTLTAATGVAGAATGIAINRKAKKHG